MAEGVYFERLCARQSRARKMKYTQAFLFFLSSSHSIFLLFIILSFFFCSFFLSEIGVLYSHKPIIPHTDCGLLGYNSFLLWEVVIWCSQYIPDQIGSSIVLWYVGRLVLLLWWVTAWLSVEKGESSQFVHVCVSFHIWSAYVSLTCLCCWCTYLDVSMPMQCCCKPAEIAHPQQQGLWNLWLHLARDCVWQMAIKQCYSGTVTGLNHHSVDSTIQHEVMRTVSKAFIHSTSHIISAAK